MPEHCIRRVQRPHVLIEACRITWNRAVETITCSTCSYVTEVVCKEHVNAEIIVRIVLKCLRCTYIISNLLHVIDHPFGNDAFMAISYSSEDLITDNVTNKSTCIVYRGLDVSKVSTEYRYITLSHRCTDCRIEVRQSCSGEVSYIREPVPSYILTTKRSPYCRCTVRILFSRRVSSKSTGTYNQSRVLRNRPCTCRCHCRSRSTWTARYGICCTLISCTVYPAYIERIDFTAQVTYIHTELVTSFMVILLFVSYSSPVCHYLVSKWLVIDVRPFLWPYPCK